MVRLITVLAPVAILAIWGGSYVWSCVMVMSAPGRPVELKYKAKGAILRIRAESYAIDWDRGTAYVSRPGVYDPNNVRIAYADHIDASGIRLPSPTAIVVRVRDVKGTLTRLSSGQFDIENYLPEQKGPPSKIPFSVSVNRADVTLVDAAGASPFKQQVSAKDIDVRGIGDQWIASGRADLEGSGSAKAEVRNMPGEGLLIQGSTAGLQLTRILEHLRTTPDAKRLSFLKDIHSASIQAFGPFAIFVPKGKALQIESRLKAIGRDVRYLDYAADQAFFDGQVTQGGVLGELDARYAGTKAKFNGSLSYRDGVSIGGELSVDSGSTNSLPNWIRKLVPTQIAFENGHFKGWLDYRKADGIRLQGIVAASSARAYGQSFDQPKVSLTYGADQVRVGIQGGRWAGTPVTGAVLVGLKTPAITGALSASALDLATVAERFHTRGLSGKAQVSVLLGGTRTNPTAVLQASGTGGYRVNGKLITGRFQAAGDYAGDRLNIERFRIGSIAGSARAIGSISIKKRTLALKVDATNIQLNKLRETLAGNINASGLVKGTLDNPRFTGDALAFGLEAAGQQIPFVSAKLTADKYRLQAQNLSIIKGTGEARGEAALTYKTGALSGKLSAENLLLNEYLGEDALGTVTIPSLTLGGTLKEPRVAGIAHGTDLVLGGINVDSIDIVSEMKGTVANIGSFSAKIGDGTITATGKYDYDAKNGTFDVNGENLALSRITPPGKGAANVTGTANGHVLATISPSGIWRGRANGTLKSVFLNDTEFGNGTWALGYDGEDLTGNASIGKLDRFLLLENVDYNTKADRINGQVSVLNGALQDLYTSTRPFFPDLSYDAKQRLDGAVGDLDTTVAFSGPIRNPDFDVKLLDAHNLVLDGKPLGALKAVGGKKGTLWNVDSFNWTGPQGTLLLNKGTVDTNGQMRLDGELSNFDLTYIGLADENWAQLQGSASLSFLATGESKSPTIRASLESTKGSAFTIGATGESFRVNLDTINVSQALYATDGSYTGGLSASGKFFYRGLSGDVVAHVPLNYPFEVPDGPKITASLNFPNVDVKDLAQYASMIDMQRSVGHLQGNIAIIGPKTNLALSGSILGQADALAFNGVQTMLHATVASVKLEQNKIVLSLTATGSAGGAIAADLETTIPDLPKTIDQIAKGDSDTVIHSPLQGTISADNFNIREASKNKEFGNYHATVNSKLTINGPAVAPLIKGDVGIADTNILLPSVFQGAGPTAEMLFNPRFEIPIHLDEVARFRTSAADVSLTGGGTLGGSLSKPDFNGTLTVQSGRINLPTARVTLEEGGTMRPSYQVNSNGDSSARVDVNLTGTTAVTAMKYGDVVQRYDIRLDITGDLLSDNGLNLNASSDPPDLSKDEILGLLGQTEALKAIGSGSGLTQSEAESRIRNALISIAVPQLTQSLTGQLAQNLGLQYLNIEYNPIEGASLDFAKVLGKGLVIQGRRQISPTIGTRKLDYDLRLTYRLPTRNVALNRVVFSVGLDQDRPWKLGVTYGFRF